MQSSIIMPHDAIPLENEPQALVTVAPKFELESYIANYTGHTRFRRLYHIGVLSTVLGSEALKLAIAEAKKGVNIDNYECAVEALATIAPDDPDAKVDEDWKARVKRKNEEKTTRIQNDLKLYRRNLVKESIRVGNLELGQHLEEIGNIYQALEYYTLIRPESTNPVHLIDMHMNIARCSFQAEDWSVTIANIQKIKSIIATGDFKDQPYTKSSTNALLGLAHLCRGSLSLACESFIEVETGPKEPLYIDYATPTDIAIYGGLLALAQKPRHFIDHSLLNHPKFRTLLAIEPTMRKILSAFVSGRYDVCLKLLEANKPDYQLDPYIGPYIDRLYAMIRRECIREYCKPFSNMKLATLERMLGDGTSSLLLEIKAMIEMGELKARLNTVDGIVTSIPKMTTDDVLYETHRQVDQSEVKLRKAVRHLVLTLSDVDASHEQQQHPLSLEKKRPGHRMAGASGDVDMKIV